MGTRLLVFGLVVVLLLVIDVYVYQGIRFATQSWTPFWKTVTRSLYWLPLVLLVATVLWFTLGNPYVLSEPARSFLISGIITGYMAKIFALIFFLADDVRRLALKWFSTPEKSPTGGELIPRSEFLTRLALVSASVPVGAVAFGILSGAHDYRIRRVSISLKNLPPEFDGITIGQVSDIHSGSFFNKTAVAGGVELMNKEKPDVLFFTGDLVNNSTSEVRDYIPVFSKFQAPLGIFSVTGNHDYGDYRSWSTQAAKQQNFEDLVRAHSELGFTLLMNSHRELVIGNSRIGIVGIENWGAGGFSKYGRLDKALAGTQDLPVNLLLSHDPSHWEAQVLSKAKVDVMFSGHTHGFQFGVEIPGIKWSPAQYIYKQWAGLYSEGNQHLYVNRGFGYLGFPGRVGMPPELTLVTLVRG